MQAIGQAMREGRLTMGLTARELARLVDKTETMISRYENGHMDPGPEARAAYVRLGILTSDQGHLPFRADEDAA